MILRRLVVVCMFLAVATLRAESDWTPLWNGKDFDGWTTWMQRPSPTSECPVWPAAPTATTPSRSDPVAIRSRSSRSSARRRPAGDPDLRRSLRRAAQPGDVQGLPPAAAIQVGPEAVAAARQAGTPRDSGLLYHVHAAPGVDGRTWARSVELQIQEHDVGDLYAVGSAIAVRARRRVPVTQPRLYDYDPAGEWTFFSQSQGSSGRCIKQPDNEKPTGEWNTVELVCLRDDSIHIVNGKVVMRLHGAGPYRRRAADARDTPARSSCSRKGPKSSTAISKSGQFLRFPRNFPQDSRCEPRDPAWTQLRFSLNCDHIHATTRRGSCVSPGRRQHARAWPAAPRRLPAARAIPRTASRAGRNSRHVGGSRAERRDHLGSRVRFSGCGRQDRGQHPTPRTSWPTSARRWRRFSSCNASNSATCISTSRSRATTCRCPSRMRR